MTVYWHKSSSKFINLIIKGGEEYEPKISSKLSVSLIVIHNKLWECRCEGHIWKLEIGTLVCNSVLCTCEFRSLFNIDLEPMFYSIYHTAWLISLPPTMMMSPPSRLIAAPWKLVFGRMPLRIVSHESVLQLGKYLWRAEESSLLSSFPPMARRFLSCAAGVDKKSEQLWCSHFGDQVDIVANSYYVMGIHCFWEVFLLLPFHLGLQRERRVRGTRNKRAMSTSSSRQCYINWICIHCNNSWLLYPMRLLAANEFEPTRTGICNTTSE